MTARIATIRPENRGDRSFEDIVVWVVGIGYAVLWLLAFVSYFRMPLVAWASDVERLLMLAGLVVGGLLGGGAWYFVVRPVLRDRLAEMGPEAPIEEWRFRHLT